MARITISLSENIAAAAADRATAEKRSTSSYVALLIEQDVRVHGTPPPPVQEFMAKVQAAAAESPAVLPALEATLRRALRTRKTAA